MPSFSQCNKKDDKTGICSEVRYRTFYQVVTCTGTQRLAIQCMMLYHTVLTMSKITGYGWRLGIIACFCVDTLVVKPTSTVVGEYAARSRHEKFDPRRLLTLNMSLK